MDYLPGGDLMSLLCGLESGRMSEDATKFYAAEVVLALEDLHKAGYVYRDLKPDNILLDMYGHIRLIDYGSCAKLDSSGQISSTNAVGTPDYVSPEVLLSQSTCCKYGIECDWWSLGVLMYEMMIGVTPFYSESLLETYNKIMNHTKFFEIPKEADLSNDAVDILNRLINESSSRLGVNGIQEIKNHPFFKGIKWEDLKFERPPFIPNPETEDCSADEELSLFLQDKKAAKSKAFLGSQLMFVGYSFDKSFGSAVAIDSMQKSLGDCSHCFKEAAKEASDAHIEAVLSSQNRLLLEQLDRKEDSIQKITEELERMRAENIDLIKRNSCLDMEIANLNIKFNESRKLVEDLEIRLSKISNRSLETMKSARNSKLLSQKNSRENFYLKSKSSLSDVFEAEIDLRVALDESANLAKINFIPLDESLESSTQLESTKASRKSFQFDTQEEFNDAIDKDPDFLEMTLENSMSNIKEELEFLKKEAEAKNMECQIVTERNLENEKLICALNIEAEAAAATIHKLENEKIILQNELEKLKEQMKNFAETNEKIAQNQKTSAIEYENLQLRSKELEAIVEAKEKQLHLLQSHEAHLQKQIDFDKIKIEELVRKIEESLTLESPKNQIFYSKPLKKTDNAELADLKKLLKMQERDAKELRSKNEKLELANEDLKAEISFLKGQLENEDNSESISASLPKSNLIKIRKSTVSSISSLPENNQLEGWLKVPEKSFKGWRKVFLSLNEHHLILSESDSEIRNFSSVAFLDLPNVTIRSVVSNEVPHVPAKMVPFIFVIETDCFLKNRAICNHSLFNTDEQTQTAAAEAKISILQKKIEIERKLLSGIHKMDGIINDSKRKDLAKQQQKAESKLMLLEFELEHFMNRKESETDSEQNDLNMEFHSFAVETIQMVEKCNYCGGLLLKSTENVQFCKACGMHCHSECKSKISIPCSEFARRAKIRQLFFKAPSGQERDRWITELNKIRKYLRKGFSEC